MVTFSSSALVVGTFYVKYGAIIENCLFDFEKFIPIINTTKQYYFLGIFLEKIAFFTKQRPRDKNQLIKFCQKKLGIFPCLSAKT